jgi:hypothetical protein
VFDREGRFLDAWGEQFEGGAHGLYLHCGYGGQQHLYFADTQRALVTKTTLVGEVLLEIQRPPRPDIYGDDRPYIPTDICVGPNGDIYIADGYGQSFVHQYTSHGAYVRSWGGRGSEAGKLMEPHGIAVNGRGEEPELYVADRRNHRIQVFSLDGVHRRFVDHDLDLPCGFYFYGSELYIADLNSRVTILDGQDRLVTHLGEDQQAYKQPGWPNLPESYFRVDRFSSPHAVCVDSHDDIYVVEWISGGRVTKLLRRR